ncbi:MAG: response regulator [Balneolaceae bacterium]
MSKKSKKKILIVEDDVFQSFYVEKMLLKLSYDVVGKTTVGQDAIAKAAELKPDIILMDITLKGEMDGITAVEEIKKKNDIAVIYITSSEEEEIYERARKTNFLDYLIKPIMIDKLKKSLKKIDA